MPSNKQSAKGATFALLATILFGPFFRMNRTLKSRVEKAILRVYIMQPPCVMLPRSMIRTQDGFLFPSS